VNNNRVVILHDDVPPAAPTDQQDTLVQANAIATALEALGFGTTRMAFDPDLPTTAAALRELNPVAVFNLVESISGIGRLAHIAPAWIEALAIPFTGSGPAAMLTTTDKLITKLWLARASIPCPENHSATSIKSDDTLWIVKSTTEDASIGLEATSVMPASQVEAKIAQAKHRFGGDWFAEQYIEGREFNLALLQTPDGVQVLPAAEIAFMQFPDGTPHIVDYAAKWDPDSFAYQNTVRLFPDSSADTNLIERMGTTALQCWDIFQLRGYARVDFRVDGNGIPWVLEVNANPCLAPDAGFAAALQQAGLSYEQAVAAIMYSAGVASPEVVAKAL